MPFLPPFRIERDGDFVFWNGIADRENTLKNQTKKLRTSYFGALIALLLAFAAMATATFAWYIYNTGAHTTEVHMAAGTSVYLEISNEYDGVFSTSTVLESFTGQLIPVSTDEIVNAAGQPQFQVCTEFAPGSAGQPSLVAKLFGEAPETAFYVTPVFLRFKGSEKCDVYLSGIDYTNDNETYPLSSASRVGLVIHEPGRNGAVTDQFIIDIDPEGVNPAAQYNTATGEEGHVLDHRYIDGTTIPFTPLTSANYVDYDKMTAIVTLKEKSEKIVTLTGGDDPVRVDIYIWVEGCDKDCTNEMMGRTLRDVSTSFAAIVEGSAD